MVAKFGRKRPVLQQPSYIETPGNITGAGGHADLAWLRRLSDESRRDTLTNFGSVTINKVPRCKMTYVQ